MKVKEKGTVAEHTKTERTETWQLQGSLQLLNHINHAYGRFGALMKTNSMLMILEIVPFAKLLQSGAFWIHISNPRPQGS